MPAHPWEAHHLYQAFDHPEFRIVPGRTATNPPTLVEQQPDSLSRRRNSEACSQEACQS